MLTSYDCWTCYLRHRIIRLAYKYRVIDRGQYYGCPHRDHIAVGQVN